MHIRPTLPHLNSDKCVHPPFESCLVRGAELPMPRDGVFGLLPADEIGSFFLPREQGLPHHHIV